MFPEKFALVLPQQPERRRGRALLYFEVALVLGEERSVLPHRAVRFHAGGMEEVLVESIAPFRQTAIGSLPGDGHSREKWETGAYAEVYFLSVRTSPGKYGENLAPSAEPPAFLVACNDIYMTAKTAADVSFRVVNRREKRVVFSGVIEGMTFVEVEG